MKIELEAYEHTCADGCCYTTKERLNGISNVRIHQKNFNWYLNDKEWDGRLIDVI